MYIDENSKPKEKLKAWYLFTEDFVAGTSHLTNEEVGVYIRLLCWNWNKRCRGIPQDSMTQYRIANCITDTEKKSCDEIIKQFFVQVNDHYQNERQLQEYLFINKRIEASKLNGKLGGRPKKPRPEPSQNPPTSTSTSTIKPKTNERKLKEFTELWKIKTGKSNFPLFWEKVKNKVSKGIAEKNFNNLDIEWKEKAVELANMYNKYFDNVEDKKFAKQPAFWLSARKYEDEGVKINEEKIDDYTFYLNKFTEAIENKEKKVTTSKIAQNNIHLVKRAINENKFTKEEAFNYLDMRGWL